MRSRILAALAFSDGGKDGEHHFRDAVAGDVATKVDQVQADLVFRQLLQRAQSVGSRAEGAVILLAAAVSKSGDEAKILKTYGAAGGRARITTYVTGQATSAVQRQFNAALNILHYWRDDAAHGQQTTISEVEAYSAISELLRLAQFASDHWAELTN
jgi:hypothetical protein